ncbi:alpha/beta hydrolase [Candidatus Saccharibacteria bacterium]|nr:alpha/beta hydrolase [Candidatus Saccharibacteria bacterium]
MGKIGLETMYESEVHIPIPNSELEIHGVLRGDYNSPLAVLAPGLGGWMHDLLLFNASRFFEKQGFATLRVSFYGDDNKQRNISDFGVKTSAADIDTVVDYVKEQGLERVCVIGHSYSGMAIVYSTKQAFDAAVLWDASHTGGYYELQAKKNLENDFMYIKELDSYVSANGSGYVLSRKVFEEYAPGSTIMAKNFNVDTLVINASNSGKAMERFGKDYANNISAETEYIVIPDASHERKLTMTLKS